MQIRSDSCWLDDVPMDGAARNRFHFSHRTRKNMFNWQRSISQTEASHRNGGKMLNLLDITSTKVIIWTNLFPVGPKKEGNASNMLCDAQTDTAIDLFREIIRYFQPTHVLVESGMNWFSFTYKGQHHSFLDCIDLSSSNYCVVGWCVFPETKSHIIIANRPEGKKDEEYCNDIIQTFNAMTDAGVVK